MGLGREGGVAAPRARARLIATVDQVAGVVVRPPRARRAKTASVRSSSSRAGPSEPGTRSLDPGHAARRCEPRARGDLAATEDERQPARSGSSPRHRRQLRQGAPIAPQEQLRQGLRRAEAIVARRGRPRAPAPTRKAVVPPAGWPRALGHRVGARSPGGNASISVFSTVQGLNRGLQPRSLGQRRPPRPLRTPCEGILAERGAPVASTRSPIPLLPQGESDRGSAPSQARRIFGVGSLVDARSRTPSPGMRCPPDSVRRGAPASGWPAQGGRWANPSPGPATAAGSPRLPPEGLVEGRGPLRRCDRRTPAARSSGSVEGAARPRRLAAGTGAAGIGRGEESAHERRGRGSAESSREAWMPMDASTPLPSFRPSHPASHAVVEGAARQAHAGARRR